MLLQALSDRHISPGFVQYVFSFFVDVNVYLFIFVFSATEQMRTYKPADHEETTSVAPLLQFFELVHIGDTIQSMAQVYFDKEMVR